MHPSCALLDPFLPSLIVSSESSVVVVATCNRSAKPQLSSSNKKLTSGSFWHPGFVRAWKMIILWHWGNQFSDKASLEGVRFVG
jgi:hypothetical protein